MADFFTQFQNSYQIYLVPFVMDFVAALVILILGFVAAKMARRGVERALGKARKIDPMLRPVLAAMVQYGLIVLVIAAVLTKVGVETASIIAALGAAGLAIGLALQGTLSNIAAGVMLLWLRPLKTGEYIDAQGIAGNVEEVGLFVTLMKRPDGVLLYVPNAQLWNKPILNFSRNAERRIDVTVGISYNDNVDGALALLQKLMADDARILAEPAPQTMVEALGDSAVNIKLRCWVKTPDFWPVGFDLNRNAKAALEADGFSIPFPQRDVHVHHHGSGAGGDANKAA
ncbi:MAG: mechanosensitive ion channel family protein [Alphaproteobacteria bacterium]